MEKKIEDNVLAFMDKAANYAGRHAEEVFHIDMYNACLGDVELQSPIEKLLWIGLSGVCGINYLKMNPEPTFYKGKEVAGFGVHILTQVKIGKYRVDFVAQDVWPQKENSVKWVIECDGHVFHERNKAERQYEKARDRFLTTAGYKILHFTGSEIVASPFKVAKEILVAVTGDQLLITPDEYWGD